MMNEWNKRKVKENFLRDTDTEWRGMEENKAEQ